MIYAILAGAGAVILMAIASDLSYCAGVYEGTGTFNRIRTRVFWGFILASAALSLALICGRLTV
jgi:hypothetical protein